MMCASAQWHQHISMKLNQVYGWPGITHQLVTKYLYNTIPDTIKGHFHQSRCNVQYTRCVKTQNIIDPTSDEDNSPIRDEWDAHHAGALHTIDISGRIYTNQTCSLPVPSSHRNKYIMVLYHYGTNPMPWISSYIILEFPKVIHIDGERELTMGECSKRCKSSWIIQTSTEPNSPWKIWLNYQLVLLRDIIECYVRY